MIRICHVQVLPLMSGTQRCMLETFQRLDAAVFEPTVVCQCEGPLTEELKRRGIAYHVVPEFGREIRPAQDLRAYFALRRLFRKEQFDLVHNHSAKPRVLAAAAARHAGVPAVINHVHGFSFHEHMPRWKRAAFERLEAWAARYCDLMLFANNEDRQYAISNKFAPASRCRTVYNGADLAWLSPESRLRRRASLRESFRWGYDEVIVAVLGRLDDQKQPLILPQIVRRLQSCHLDRPWRMMIAGDGHLRPQLDESIARYRLGHLVHVLGWHDSPADVLHASDILLLPSLWEGLPRVLIEAAAVGLPCVASNIRGNREVVSPETGIVVDPHSVTGYASALTRLIENESLRAQLGRAARRRAEELFDSDRNERAIIRHYCELLQVELPREQRRAA